MIEKEDAKLRFDDSSIQRFTTVTPEGNEISGWKCKSRNHMYGSLLIDTLNGEDHNQFIRGTPKITYYNPRRPPQLEDARVLEKLDGTNILAFAIIKDGEVLEVCHKTRTPNFGDSMVNKAYRAKLEEVWNSNYEDLVRANPEYSFSFELYGTAGKIANEVKYDYINDVDDVNLTLLSVMNEYGILTYEHARFMADFHRVPIVDELFTFETIVKGNLVTSRYRVSGTKALYNRYGVYAPQFDKEFNSIESAISHLRYEYLEDMNVLFQEDHGGIIIEGVVWHVFNGDDTVMLKNKPNSVHEGHTIAGGIPAPIIRKAVRKAKDKFHLAYEYKGNPEAVLTFIGEELKEEYSEEEVAKEINQNKIRSAISSLIRKSSGRTVEEQYLDIARDIISSNPDLDNAPDCMREFAANPDYSNIKQFNKMFNAFQLILEEK